MCRVLTSDVCSHFSFLFARTCLPSLKHNPDEQPLEHASRSLNPKFLLRRFVPHRAQQKVTLAQFNAASLFLPSIVDSCVLRLPGDQRSASRWPFLAAYWVSEQRCAVLVCSCSSWQLTGPQRWSRQSRSKQVKSVKDSGITDEGLHCQITNNTKYVSWNSA